MNPINFLLVENFFLSYIKFLFGLKPTSPMHKSLISSACHLAELTVASPAVGVLLLSESSLSK